MISLRLTETTQQIQEKINRELASMVNDKLFQKRSYILIESKKLAESWILSQPEITSLNGGDLSGLFGLYFGSESAIINTIISSITSSITTELVKIDPQFKKGGLRVNFQPSNFVNLLSLKAGHVVYKNGDLHWMDWLITQGDKIIVTDYSFNPKLGAGRSKKGTMTNKGFFRVPPQYSGTLENNFVTRALTGATQQRQINELLQGALT
jgi:hypothetical protein